ncbi:hypothetical protein BN59_03248 [Legionella massiliensis]|uniref:Uncharacterized protein n=1 Tax=Legionella massiliensis TaxID=1034943 RepID=A0A078L4V8_9GAMM|nr:hypothetical protein [Legionella massiliensis]CDZ78933.1 hypothetical protein BN59_03248 [Legionella massiliensis]CEE14671.1 hypothetical protein BN1094_03248 [Legionella massiliensis]
MIQKIKCSLVCSALALFGTNLWASGVALPLNVSQAEPYILKIGETKTLTNLAPWKISAKCTISTQDEGCHSVYAKHEGNSPLCTVNGDPLVDSITFDLCHNQALILSAESAASVSFTNNSKTSYIAISCSIIK